MLPASKAMEEKKQANCTRSKTVYFRFKFDERFNYDRLSYICSHSTYLRIAKTDLTDHEMLQFSHDKVVEYHKIFLYTHANARIPCNAQSSSRHDSVGSARAGSINTNKHLQAGRREY